MDWCWSAKRATKIVELTNEEKEIGFEVGPNKRHVVKVKLEIHKMDGFTGHAGRQELMDCVGKCSPRPKKKNY